MGLHLALCCAKTANNLMNSGNFTYRGVCVHCVCGAHCLYLRNVGYTVEWNTLSITVGTWPSQPLWSGQWGRFFPQLYDQWPPFQMYGWTSSGWSSRLCSLTIKGGEKKFPFFRQKCSWSSHELRERFIYDISLSVFMSLHFGCAIHNDEDTRFSELHSKILYVRDWRSSQPCRSGFKVLCDVTPCHCVKGSRSFETTMVLFITTDQRVHEEFHQTTEPGWSEVKWSEVKWSWVKCVYYHWFIVM